MKNRCIKLIDLLLLITTGILSRLIPHPANFTAIGGIALFSGSHFTLKKSVVIVMITMLVTDMILGMHPVMWATYGSILITLMLGRSLKKSTSVQRILSVTLISSVIFYLLTNFAVWLLPGSLYPKTPFGLLESYIMALPFFRNSLLGDLFYATSFFGLSAVVQRRFVHDMIEV